MSALGDYIKERRKYGLKITQAALSKRLGDLGEFRDSATIANWETGRQDVPLELIPVLALALEETSLNHLYDLSGVIEKLNGADIIRMLNNLDPRDIERVKKLISVYLDDK